VESDRQAGVNARHFVMWLGLASFIMLAALGATLLAVWRQGQSFELTARLRADSITALTFQLEREFLRLRSDMGKAVASNEAVDVDALALRLDIMISRVNLLEDNPTTRTLALRAPYQTVMPRLQALVRQSEVALTGATPRPIDLAALLVQYEAIGPDVQALSLDANSLMTGVLEEQVRTLQRKNRQVMGLLAGLMLMGLIGFVTVARRQFLEAKQRSALVRLTEERQQALLQAEAANRGKSQFLANMSHELRTPFNGMLGMLTLLESSRLDLQQRDCVDTARRSAEHLLALLNDILDMSALEAGRLSVSPQDISLLSLLGDVEALMRGQALGKNLQLTVDRAADLPDRVVADPTRLKQVLFNLIGNAVKFTDQGEVRLKVDLLEPGSAVAPAKLKFTVSDTGIGMDADTLGRLFQRFQQSDNSATRRYGGTGLGLEISRTLARMMGGDVAASSELGKGSTFTFTLALPLCAQPAQTSAQPQTEPLGAIAEQAANRLCVLVAEDHPINQKLIRLLLERHGHTVTMCANGELAFQALQKQTYDVVLMDMHMPVMDGILATERIRALPGPAGQVPIVALTADVVADVKERALASGMNGYLSKPVSPGELQRTLQELTRGT
jgi:signal transduction histidine kinase/ActR/RegA family two-component response regulator